MTPPRWEILSCKGGAFSFLHPYCTQGENVGSNFSFDCRKGRNEPSSWLPVALFFFLVERVCRGFHPSLLGGTTPVRFVSCTCDVLRCLCLRDFTRIAVSTAPDPRNDTYNLGRLVGFFASQWPNDCVLPPVRLTMPNFSFSGTSPL